MKRVFQFAAIPAIALLSAVGCGQKEETGVGLKPQLQLEGKTLEEKIAAVEADQTIPPDYKATYINSLKAQAAATAGGTGTPANK